MTAITSSKFASLLTILILLVCCTTEALHQETKVVHKQVNPNRKLRASLQQKWNLTNPEVSYSKYQFNLEYTTSDFIQDGWVSYTLYDSPICGDGGNDITTSSNSGPGGQNYLTTTGLIAKSSTPFRSGPESGEGFRNYLLSLNIEPRQIGDSPLYTEPPRGGGAVVGEITFCARFSLWNRDDFQEADSSAIEINFQETVMTIYVDLTDGFDIDDIGLNPKQSNETAKIGCEVFAYHCDRDNQRLAENGRLMYQGEEMRVCVEATEESIQSGLYIDRLYNFTWIRDDFNDGIIDVSQTAIIPDALPAWNGLTTIECVPGSIICAFTTLLKADFFRFYGRVNGTGLAVCRLGPTPPPEYFLDLIDFGGGDVDIIDRDTTENIVYDGNPVGSKVGIVAMSADLIWTKKPTQYTLIDDGNGCFEIHPITGEVTIKDRTNLDFERGSMSITVQSDAGYNSVHTQSYEITLIDLIDEDKAENKLYDGHTNNGDVVHILPRAADQTRGPFGYELRRNPGNAFEIDRNTGVITVRDESSINWNNWYEQTISVRVNPSIGDSMNKDFTIKFVRLLDRRGRGNYVREDAISYSEVGITAAPNGHMTDFPITYYLSDSAGGCFDIGPSDGIVVLRDYFCLDFDAYSYYDITILASDKFDNRVSRTFRINLIRVDDKDGRYNSIPDNCVNGQEVGVAVKPINQALGPFYFALSNDSNGIFEIDAETGVVTITDCSRLDFEATASYRFTALITTAISTTMARGWRIYCFRVTDNDPEPNELPEDATNGQFTGIRVGRTGKSTNYKYELISDDCGGCLYIEYNTGFVTVLDVTKITWTISTAIRFSVQLVKGSDTRPVGDFEIMLRRVEDIDESYNAVYENSFNGATVGVTCRPVIVKEGVSYTYSLDDTSLFNINSATGVVTVNNLSSFGFSVGSIPLEVPAGPYPVTCRVRASDGDEMVNTIDVYPTRIIDADPSLNIADKLIRNGYPVGLTVQPARPDPSISYSYSLSEDSDGRFRINSSTGEVTVNNKDNLDFVNLPSYNITAKVTRSQGSAYERWFMIDLVEAQPTGAPSASPSESFMPTTSAPTATPTCEVDSQCPVDKVCVQKLCIQAGNRWTLTWNGDDDLDLHVITPSGNEVFWAKQFDESSNLFLDHDDRPKGMYGEWVENIAFPRGVEPEIGIYTFFVMNHDHFEDADPFEVKMFFDDVEVMSYTGQIEGDFSNGKLYYFEYQGNGQWPATQCRDSPDGWYYDAPALSDDHYWRNHYFRTRNCAYFAVGNNCADYGDIALRWGRTPNEACCACGGGTTGSSGPFTGSVDIPTLAPSIVPHEYDECDCVNGRRLQDGGSCRRLQEGETCDSKFLINCGQEGTPAADKMPQTFVPWPLEDSIKVVDRQDTTVEFQIQNNFGQNIKWIQIHYPTDLGEVCSTTYNIPYGEYTDPVKATCMGGVCSAVRVYVATTDNTFDNSNSYVSELCEALPADDSSIKGTAGYLLNMACNAQCSLDVANGGATTSTGKRALSIFEEDIFQTNPEEFRRVLQSLGEADNANGGPFALQITTAKGTFTSGGTATVPMLYLTTTCFVAVVSVFAIAFGLM